MVYTIYKTTNLINGKFYIGKHQTENPNDSYLGSGRALKDAINKYGKHNFKKEILFEFDNEALMNEKEKELITEEFINRPDTYNIGIGGEGGPHFKGKKHSPEVIEKLKNRPITDKHRENARKSGLMSRGRKHSEQARKNIANGARKRPPMSEETKQKISQSLKGKNGKKSLQRSQKMEGNKNAHVLKTDEARKRHSEIMKLAWKKRKEKNKS